MSHLTSPSGKRTRDINSNGLSSNQDSVPSERDVETLVHETRDSVGITSGKIFEQCKKSKVETDSACTSPALKTLEPQLAPVNSDTTAQASPETVSVTNSSRSGTVTKSTSGTVPISEQEICGTRTFKEVLSKATSGPNPIPKIILPKFNDSVSEATVKSSPFVKNLRTDATKEPSPISSVLVTESTMIMEPIVSVPVTKPTLKEAKFFNVSVPIPTTGTVPAEWKDFRQAPVSESLLDGSPLFKAPKIKSVIRKTPVVSTAVSEPVVVISTVSQEPYRNDNANLSSKHHATPNSLQAFANASTTENPSGIDDSPTVFPTSIITSGIFLQLYHKGYVEPTINAARSNGQQTSSTANHNIN